jgi:hypothetical protein
MRGEIHCYACGQPGHIRIECPAAQRPTPAPPPSSAPDHGNLPPPFNPYWLRPADQIADPKPWADMIRAENGWKNGSDDEERMRVLAAEQCAEARAARMIRL